MMRSSKAVTLVITVLASLLLISSAAVSAGSPAAGTLRLFVRPTGAAGGRIVATGAVGDYGTVLSIDQTGHRDPNGNFVKVTLKKGSFKLNVTAFNAVSKRARPTIDEATCSASVTATAPSSLLDGAGRYKGSVGRWRPRTRAPSSARATRTGGAKVSARSPRAPSR